MIREFHLQENAICLITLSVKLVDFRLFIAHIFEGAICSEFQMNFRGFIWLGDFRDFLNVLNYLKYFFRTQKISVEFQRSAVYRSLEN